MSDDGKPRVVRVENGLMGGLWFIGWLFTIAYASLTGWQILLSLVAWPYYLGLVLK